MAAFVAAAAASAARPARGGSGRPTVALSTGGGRHAPPLLRLPRRRLRGGAAALPLPASRIGCGLPHPSTWPPSRPPAAALSLPRMAAASDEAGDPPAPPPPDASDSSKPTPSTFLSGLAGNDAAFTPPADPEAFLRGPVPGDRLLRTMSSNGEVTVRAVSATGLVAASCHLHRTSPVASAAFGRALLSGLLLAAGKKGAETTQIELRGDGPLRGIMVVANGVGEVRGYVGEPRVVLPPKADGSLNVGAAVGRGVLAVVRNAPHYKRPFTGLTAIVTGEVGDELAEYLASSEQTPSALGVGVGVGADGRVTSASGFLVQVLPGASEESVATVERNVKALSEGGVVGRAAEEMVEVLMAGLSPLTLVETAPRFTCKCSVERVKRTVRLLGRADCEALVAERGSVDATCEFCGHSYGLSGEEVLAMFAGDEGGEGGGEAGDGGEAVGV